MHWFDPTGGSNLASLNLPHYAVMSVAAVDSTKNLAYFSQRNSQVEPFLETGMRGIVEQVWQLLMNSYWVIIAVLKQLWSKPDSHT